MTDTAYEEDETRQAAATSATAGSEGSGASGTASFDLQANLIVVEVAVNSVPGRFILDTGASTTVIAEHFAEQLGLEAARQEVGQGAGGEVAMGLSRVERVSVAGLEKIDLTCPVTDLGALCTQVGKIDGILGFSFFGRGTLSIDYPRRQVSFVWPAGASDLRSRVEGDRLDLPGLGLQMSLALDGWRTRTDTDLPSVAAILVGPDGEEIEILEVEAIGLGLDEAVRTTDRSLQAQVEDFQRIDSALGDRGGLGSYRVEYRGNVAGRPHRLVTEVVLTESGLLLVTGKTGGNGFEGVQTAIRTLMNGVRPTSDQGPSRGSSAMQ